MKTIGIGLLGFGTVGAGVAAGLQQRAELLTRRLGAEMRLRRVADLDLDSDRGVVVDRSIMTRDARVVINDPDVQIVVELIGGCGVARDLILEALQARKPVVTANKKLLAEHGDEIFGAAEKAGVDLYFGASVGGGMPIVRVLREGLIANEVRRILGILNGTCNFILTRMTRDALSFEAALREAQAAGYAEADPRLDIDGLDTAHKAAILASLAYGFHVPMQDIPVEGIRSLEAQDVQYARELGYRIKLLAMIRRDEAGLDLRVHPTLVPDDHMLASVNNVFNAVMVQSDPAGDTLYYGRGAGREPTASTVLGDIADVARNLISGRARYRRGVSVTGTTLPLCPLSSVRSRYYFRLMVLDQPGSLGRFTSILGRHEVSISAVMQRDVQQAGGVVPVVVLSHLAREADVNAALAEIYASGIVGAQPVRLRMLD